MNLQPMERASANGTLAFTTCRLLRVASSFTMPRRLLRSPMMLPIYSWSFIRKMVSSMCSQLDGTWWYTNHPNADEHELFLDYHFRSNIFNHYDFQPPAKRQPYDFAVTISWRYSSGVTTSTFMMGSITMGFAFPAPSLKAALASCGGWTTRLEFLWCLLQVSGSYVQQYGLAKGTCLVEKWQTIWGLFW